MAMGPRIVVAKQVSTRRGAVHPRKGRLRATGLPASRPLWTHGAGGLVRRRFLGYLPRRRRSTDDATLRRAMTYARCSPRFNVEEFGTSG